VLWEKISVLKYAAHSLPSPLSLSTTLGRIIRLTQEVIDYREWIIKKWGGRQLARTESRGERLLTHHYMHCHSPY